MKNGQNTQPGKTTKTNAKNPDPNQFRLHGTLLHLSFTPRELAKLRADLSKAKSTLLQKLTPRSDEQMLLKVHWRMNKADFYLQHQH